MRTWHLLRRVPARAVLAAVTAAAVLPAPTAFAGNGNADSSLDPKFGLGGIVRTAVAPNGNTDYQNGLAIDSRRRILVTGSSDLGEAAGGFQWRIARYTPDGRLDRSFGSGGIVLTPMSDMGGDDEHIWRLAVQQDGKIVAAGHVATADGGEDFAVARYLPDGSLDRTFGTRGRVVTALTPHDDEAQALRVQHDGRIVVAGYASIGEDADGRDFALVRYLPDGRLDRSFNRSGPRPGTVVTDIEGGRDQLRDITLDTRGRIVAAGSATLPSARGGTSFAVARYLHDGTLDPSFGSGTPRPGVVVTPMAANDGLDLAESVVIDRHHRILAGGSADADGRFDLALARYRPDGSLDPRFGNAGKVLANVGPGSTDEDLAGLALQPDGRILAGGSTAPTEFAVDSDFLLARFREDGSLDRGFGRDGFVITRTAPGEADDEIFDIALQTPNRLVAAGECDQPSTGRDVCLARYLVSP
ncbi:delta-60 repeat domain-containing protein [Streptomyces sp. NPDC004126]|uniref:delta-60 repeat domain-containing protein n=1 Tax=Streptomyces sp. NPDC004126 TaxID=3390695 RepID=UPI003D06EBB5